MARRRCRARGEAGDAERRDARVAEQLRREVRDARVHARPAGDRQGRSGRAPRVLRPRRSARLQPARASLPAGLRGGDRAAQRGAARSRSALLARRARAVDGAGRRARGASSSSARRDALARSAPGFAERAGELGLPGARSPTRASRRPPRSSRRGSSATSSAATTALGPHLHDVRLARRRPRPAQLRLAGRAAPDRARARCSPRPSCCASARRAAAPPARRRPLGARRGPPPRARRARRRHAGRRLSPRPTRLRSRRAGAARRGRARHGEDR